MNVNKPETASTEFSLNIVCEWDSE